MNDPYRELAARLQVLIDDLDAIAFDELREAAGRGAPRPDSDRRAMRARRAMEKAVFLLAGEQRDDLGDTDG